MNTSPQEQMLGLGIKNQSSATSRSKQVNDRERRTIKRSEKGCWREDVKNGLYFNMLIA